MFVPQAIQPDGQAAGAQLVIAAADDRFAAISAALDELLTRSLVGEVRGCPMRGQRMITG